MYRGRRRHLRLFKPLGPNMWNFTGRAAMIPDLTGIEHLMSCRETATMPQRDIASIKADHLFLGKKWFCNAMLFTFFTASYPGALNLNIYSTVTYRKISELSAIINISKWKHYLCLIIFYTRTLRTMHD